MLLTFRSTFGFIWQNHRGEVFYCVESFLLTVPKAQPEISKKRPVHHAWLLGSGEPVGEIYNLLRAGAQSFKLWSTQWKTHLERTVGAFIMLVAPPLFTLPSCCSERFLPWPSQILRKPNCGAIFFGAVERKAGMGLERSADTHIKMRWSRSTSSRASWYADGLLSIRRARLLYLINGKQSWIWLLPFSLRTENREVGDPLPPDKTLHQILAISNWLWLLVPRQFIPLNSEALIVIQLENGMYNWLHR